MSGVRKKEVLLALRACYGKKGMSEADLVKLSEYIISFFGTVDEVIDVRLTSEDRDVFSMLQEEGILTTTEEDVILKKGKVRRIKYWQIDADEVLRLSGRKGVAR